MAESYEDLSSEEKWELEKFQLELTAINVFFSMRSIDPADLSAVKDMHKRVRNREDAPDELRNERFLADIYDTQKWDRGELEAFAVARDKVAKDETFPGVSLESLRQMIKGKQQLLEDSFYRILTAERYMIIRPVLPKFSAIAR